MLHKPKFFLQNKVKSEVKELFAAIWIQNFAVMLITLFVPIYLFELGFPVWKILFFFFLVYLVYFFTIPIGGWLSAKRGYEHTMALAMPVTVVYYLALFGVQYSETWLYVAAVLFAFSKTLYWPPYHAGLSRFGGKEQRGRELSIMFVVGQLTIFAAPLIAGSVLGELSFGWLFFIGSVLLIISVFPLLRTKEKVYGQDVAYKEYYQRFFAKEHRRRFVTYLGLGEELVGMTIWPLLIFSVVGDFLIFGGILTAAMLVSSLLLLFTGRLTDKFPKDKLARVMHGVYFLTWFPKLFIQVSFHAFLTDSLGQFTRTAAMIPFNAIVYEEAKENYKNRVILGAVLYEMGYIFTKIFVALILMLLAFWTDDLRILMLVGAATTLFYLGIKQMKR